jgi:hypothetical protein
MQPINNELWIAVEIDNGIIWGHDFPKVYDFVPNALRVLSRLKHEAGAKLIATTCRNNADAVLAYDFINDKIQFDGLNRRPNQHIFTDSLKPFANYYIDPKGVGMFIRSYEFDISNLYTEMFPFGERKHNVKAIDWMQVEEFFIQENLLIDDRTEETDSTIDAKD